MSVAHELDMGGELFDHAAHPHLRLVIDNTAPKEPDPTEKMKDKDLEDWYGHLSPEEIALCALINSNRARIAQLQMTAARDVNSYDNNAYCEWLNVYQQVIGPYDGIPS